MQTTTHRSQLKKARTWVIKLGSSLVTNNGLGLRADLIQNWCQQVASLKKQGKQLILVSSGATAEGFVRLGWERKHPRALHELQAAAAIGQMGLIQTYEQCFQQHKITTAQILLTHDDVANRRRYLNARSTFRALLALGVIPIVNENDTVATQEIRLGDNDTLAGLVANLIEAELMVILTDQPGLMDKDPGLHHDAVLLPEVRAGDSKLLQYAGGSSILGRGGMLTKLKAAEIAARSGTNSVIANGKEKEILLKIAAGKPAGTLLYSVDQPITARKRWLASQKQVPGQLHLDQGAANVLCKQGKSLLGVGVKSVTGEFSRGAIVSCHAPDGIEIARGLINYSAEEAHRIIGKASKEIEAILGYVAEPELIHRDNLILLQRP